MTLKMFYLLIFYSLVCCIVSPQLSMEDIEVKEGELACMNIKANLKEIDGFQFSINWDTSLLKYKESNILINEPMTSVQINPQLHFEGVLSMSGSNQKDPISPWSIKDNEICEVCWEVLGKSGQTANVKFSDYNVETIIWPHKFPMPKKPDWSDGSILIK